MIMARTAQTNLRIQNNGTPLTTGAFTTIDLKTGLSGADEGNNVASITGSTIAGSNLAVDTVSAVTSGANITLDLTTLSHTFVAIEIVFRNGQATSATDWSRVGNTITVTDAVSSEIFQVQYTY
jgi:hypothetical protein